MMGTLVRQTGTDREWQVGRSDVEDHRQMNYGMGRFIDASFCTPAI